MKEATKSTKTAENIIKLRGHHLTGILQTQSELEKNIEIQMYGKEHYNYVNQIREKVYNSDAKIEIVKGFDDICNQCILLDQCKINHVIIQSEYERIYRDKTGDYESEFITIDLMTADKEELRKLDALFTEKNIIKKRLYKLGLNKDNTHTSTELIRLYEKNYKK